MRKYDKLIFAVFYL